MSTQLKRTATRRSTRATAIRRKDAAPRIATSCRRCSGDCRSWRCSRPANRWSPCRTSRAPSAFRARLRFAWRTRWRPPAISSDCPTRTRSGLAGRASRYRSSYLYSMDVVDVARPMLEMLRDRVGATANLGIRHGTVMLYVVRAHLRPSAHQLAGRTCGDTVSRARGFLRTRAAVRSLGQRVRTQCSMASISPRSRLQPHKA